MEHIFVAESKKSKMVKKQKKWSCTFVKKSKTPPLLYLTPNKRTQSFALFQTTVCVIEVLS